MYLKFYLMFLSINLSSIDSCPLDRICSLKSHPGLGIGFFAQPTMTVISGCLLSFFSLFFFFFFFFCLVSGVPLTKQKKKKKKKKRERKKREDTGQPHPCYLLSLSEKHFSSSLPLHEIISLDDTDINID